MALFFGALQPLLSQVIEVRDEMGEPIPAAVIRNNNGEVRMTDMDGRLQLDSLIRQGDTLQVRSMGFSARSVAMPKAQLDLEINLVPDLVNLSEVVVAGTRPFRELASAATLSRISASEVAREVPTNAATMLWQSGQVHVQQSQQGGGSPVLRGFEANRILLVVDGVRMNNAIYRSGHLQNAMTVDPFVLASMEVHHGAGSVQFGSDALGGVIHYRSRSPRWEFGSRARGQFSYSGASRSPTFHADAEVTRGRLAVLTSVTTRHFGDLRMGAWRPHGSEDWGRVPWEVATEVNGLEVTDRAEANADPDVQPGTGFDQIDLLQKVRYGDRERHVELNVQHSTGSNVPRFDRLNDAASDGSPKWAQWDYGPQKRTLVSARFAGRVRSVGNVALTAAWQHIEESRLKALFGSQEREVQHERVGVRSISLDVDRMGRRQWRKAIGAYWSMDEVQSEAWMERRSDGLRLTTPTLTRYPNGGSEMGSLALYTGVERRWNRWRVEAAARYSQGWLESRFDAQPGLELPFDQVSYNRGALTGSGTLRWSPRDHVGLHAVLSTAFRNPNVDDVGKVRAKDGFAVIPSDQLKPERLSGLEMGGFWRSRNGQVKAHVSGFYTELRDAIVPVDTVFFSADGAAIETIVVEGRHQPDSGQHQHWPCGHQWLTVACVVRAGIRLALQGHRQFYARPGHEGPGAFGAHSAGIRKAVWQALLGLAFGGSPLAVERSKVLGPLWSGRHRQPGGGPCLRWQSRVVDLGRRFRRPSDRTDRRVGSSRRPQRLWTGTTKSSPLASALPGRDVRGAALRWSPSELNPVIFGSWKCS